MKWRRKCACQAGLGKRLLRAEIYLKACLVGVKGSVEGHWLCLCQGRIQLMIPPWPMVDSLGPKVADVS